MYTLSCFSRVWLYATPWIVCSLPGFSVFGDSPGKNTGEGCHFLLQGVFLTQESNPCLFGFLHWQADSLPLVPPGKAQLENVIFSKSLLKQWNMNILVFIIFFQRYSCLKNSSWNAHDRHYLELWVVLHQTIIAYRFLLMLYDWYFALNMFIHWPITHEKIIRHMHE